VKENRKYCPVCGAHEHYQRPLKADLQYLRNARGIVWTEDVDAILLQCVRAGFTLNQTAAIITSETEIKVNRNQVAGRKRRILNEKK
jgi:hypothetical protein